MKSLRLHLPLFLMIMAIVAVISFQGYWLYKNYQEEKQGLRVQTNILFREAVYLIHAEKMKLDTSIKFRHLSSGNIRGIPVERRLRDSLQPLRTFNSKVLIRSRQPMALLKDSIEMEIDSSRARKFIARSPADARTFIEYFETTATLQDSITLPELEKQYKTMLARENIDLPFTISKSHAAAGDEFMPPDFESANKVTIGFLKPVTFTVMLGSTTKYILGKMLPIILVSLLLVTLTVLSFALLYRNLIRQRKLTQLKNDFISNITHELKTPISTVSVAIEAMKNFNALDDPKRTQEYLSISANELQRLSLLVDKVLRLSMFEKKEIQFKKEPFDLSQLVLEVMDSMKLQFEKQRAITSMQLTGDNFIIEADKRHIASVVYNLVDNALKYSTGSPKIDVQIADKSSFIEIRVSDNGPGIPHEYKNKIFEQFFRVPNGDRHNIKGYGLGLSYANHIVRSHRGFIELETQLTKGSTFIVKLPFAEAPVIHYDKNRVLRQERFRL